MPFQYCSEPSEMARDERKTKRNKQCGYPPVTPNASAADNLISETFDQLWEEVNDFIFEAVFLTYKLCLFSKTL